MTNRSIVYSLILTVVVVESSSTLVVGLAEGSPIELGIGVLLGSGIGAGLFALLIAPRQLWHWFRPWLQTPGQIFNRPFWLMLLSRFDWPLLALAAHLIGITQMALIWGLKPVMFIVCLRRLVYSNTGGRRYPALIRSTWLWLVLAGAGVGLVVISRPAQAGVASSWLEVGAGVIAALASVSLAGLSGIRLEWARGLLPATTPTKRTRLELPLIIAGLALAGLPAGLILSLVYRLGGNWPAWTNLQPGLVIGLIIATGWSLATVAWLRTRRLEVGGLFYLTPPLSVVLLLLAGRLGQIDPWLFGLGGLLIIGSSLALVRADRQTPG